MPRENKRPPWWAWPTWVESLPHKAQGFTRMPLVLDAIRVHPCVSVILQSKQSGPGTRAAGPELLPRREAALGGFKL